MRYLLIVLALSVAACAPPALQPVAPIETAYDRSYFSGWVDADGDCQDTRAEMLIAASRATPTLRPDGCTVVAGLWLDPYSGRTFRSASQIDIDHLVPLKWAWEHGAATWPKRKADRFALDPDNLVAVSASQNRSKGALGSGPIDRLAATLPA